MLVYFKKFPKEMCLECIMGIKMFLYLIFPTNFIVTTLPLSQLLFSEICSLLSISPAGTEL